MELNWYNTGINRIYFDYGVRNRKEEAFINGVRFTTPNILKKIKIYSGNSTLFRQYNLEHNLTSLNYERLISITEKSSNGNTLNPTIFNYNDTTNSNLFQHTNTNISLNNINALDYSYISGDFTSSAKVDFILYPKRGSYKRQKYYIFQSNNNDTFSNTISRTLNYKFETIFPVTYINNNRFSLKQGYTLVKKINTGFEFKVYNNGNFVYEKIISGLPTETDIRGCSRSGSQCYPYGERIVDVPKNIISGDFNGDGVTDVLAIDKGFNRRLACVSVPGSPRDGPECITPPILSNNKSIYFIDLKIDVTNDFWNFAGELNNVLPINTELYKIKTADFNGDSKTDLMVFLENKLTVYSLDDNNTLQQIAIISYDSDINMDKPILLGDYNGDGKTDFVIPESEGSKYWNFYFSRGNNFYKKTAFINLEFHNSRLAYFGLSPGSARSLEGNTYIPVDINQDGKTDIVAQSNYTVGESCNSCNFDIGDPQLTRLAVAENMEANMNNISFNVTGGTHNLDFDLNIGRYPLPVFLHKKDFKQSLDYALISNNKIHRFKYSKNHQQDVLLREITNGNGVKEKIHYAPLDHNIWNEGTNIYRISGDIQQVNYPYKLIGDTPSFQVVSKLEKHGGPSVISSPYSKQIFAYTDAIINVNGLGFMGFSKILRSNWFNNDYPLISNVSWYDYLKRGAITNTFSRLGINYPEWFLDTPTSFINKTENTYTSTLSTSKVFKIKNTNTKSYNGLQNTSIENTATHDQYNNVLTNTLLTKENGTTIKTEVTTLEYEHNPTGNNLNNPYYIGRLKKKINNSNLNGDVFTSEEQFTYNNELLLTEKKVKGNNTPFITDTFTYDVYGNILTKEVSTLSLPARTSSFEYDSTGRFITKSTDLEGLETNFTYDYNGKLLTKTNPYNLTSTYEYDTWGKLIKEIDFLGNEKSIIYSRSGSLGKTKIEVFNPDGSKSYQLLDPLGRKFNSNSYGYSENWVNQKTYYDIYDRVIKTSEPRAFGANSGPYQYNFNTYDDYGRKTEIALFNGKTTSISYNGLTTIATDGYKTVSTTKNALGQVVELIDDGGTILYEYYANGKLKQTNFDGNITSMEYDGWGKKTKLIDTSAGEYTYEYNDFGETIKETTPNGETIYRYNNIGKLYQKHITGSGTDLLSNYQYDSSTKLLERINTNQNTSYNYYYDSYKRLVRTTEMPIQINQDGFIYSNQVTYDNLSRINTEQKYTEAFDISSIVTTKNIYKKGALWKILDNSNQNVLWQLNTVNARGQVEESIFGNDIKENITYDDYGLISNISSLNNVTNNTLIQLDYNFDQERGLLLSRSNSLFNFNENFAYDDLNRLTSYTNTNGQQETQTYDSKGRIKTNNIGNHYYNNAKPYQLTTVKLNGYGQNYYQDRPLQQISYNAFKAPRHITESGYDRMYFYYNIFQQRTKTIYDRQGGGVYNKEKYFTYDGNVEIKRNIATNQTEILTFIGGDGYSSPVIYKTNGTTSGFEYLHRDNQGTIIAVSNQQANLIEKRAFDAWGNIAYVTDEQDNNLTELTVIDRGYTGHEHLANVALINMNARLYDAKLHRFLAPDNFVQDVFNTQNYNRYSYVLNNPLSYVDPSGEVISVFAAALIGAAVGVLTNGIVNSINNQPFFQGAGMAAVMGAIGGAASWGIGTIATSGGLSGVSATAKFAFQTLSHAYLGGVMTGINGGEFIHGFISGGVASMITSAAGSALSGVTSSFLQAGGMIFSGAIAGGVASEVSGGKFWDGFRNGLISAGLNHAAHTIYKIQHFKSTIKQMLVDAKYPVYGKPTYTYKYINDMINKIPLLKEWFEKSGSPKIWKYSADDGSFGKYDFVHKDVSLNFFNITTNFRLLSTMFHEFFHGFQTVNGITDFAIKEFNSPGLNEGSRGRAFLELQAELFTYSLGDNSDNTMKNINTYRYTLTK